MQAEDLVSALASSLDKVGQTREVDPDRIRADTIQSRDRKRVGELEDDLERSLDSLRADEKLPDLLFRLANMHFQEGGFGRAIVLYERTLQLDSKMLPAWLHMALAYLMLNQYKDAVRCMTDALEVDPNDPAINLTLARAYIGMGNLEKSRLHLERAMEYDPDNHEAFRVKALYLEAIGRPEQAVTWLRRAIWKKATFASAYLDLGRLYISQNRLVLAKQILTDGMHNSPEHPGILTALGDLHMKSGEYEKALEKFNAALSTRMDDPILWIKKGDMHKMLKSYDEASRAYEKAINADPESVEAWIRTARILVLENDIPTALECFNTARALAPSDWDAAYERGMVLASAGKLQEALSDLDDAFSVAPDRPESLYQRAQILEKLYRNDEARRTWEVAAQLYREEGETMRAAECVARMKRLK